MRDVTLIDQPNSSGRQTRRFQEKREAILDAAARSINRYGVRGTTLTDVGASVGLMTNSVTYYYRKKEDLAVACYLRAFETLEHVLGVAERQTTAEGRVRAFQTGYFRLLAEIASGERSEFVSFNDITALTGSAAEVVAPGYINLFRRVRGLITAGGASSLSRIQANARTQFLLAVTLWARVWVNRYEVDGYARAADHASDIMLRGFGAPHARWAPQPLDVSGLPEADNDEVSPEAFLRAATRLINEQGFHGASVEKISASLNVTKGSFYHHNDNKDDLIVDCFARSFAVIRRTQAAAAGCENGWQQLCSAAAALVRFQVSNQGPLLRITARSGLPEAAADETLRTMNRQSERFANFVVDGIADGSVRPVDPAIVAQLVNGMINAAASITRWVPGADIGNAADLFARPLFMGLLSGDGK